ncbi:hypothetical protein [Seohaeicola zhoushanensis]|uniref:Uncharacterized protein n=1 Tax=Seohaeicola zhoushanensis TaxID=1569283 RepID=A0A8J3GTI3_9RHOB|nr:hypothetical protein [Seohaeicola zhoushanensis]GHF32660.1 hypothetical protein GCM10017056_00020 [Seohaeicola zhoushanensis]
MKGLGFLLALGVLAAPEPAPPAHQGGALPPLVTPNRFVDAAGGSVSVVTIREPEGFAEAVRDADRSGVIDAVWQAGKIGREQGREAEVFVVFVDDWTAAQGFAKGIRSGKLAQHYAGLADNTSVDLFQANPRGDRMVQWITIAQRLAPYEIPTACYARLVVSVIYTAGNPGDFAMRDCAKSRK